MVFDSKQNGVAQGRAGLECGKICLEQAADFGHITPRLLFTGGWDSAAARGDQRDGEAGQ
jgi:hypothetical protein